MRAGRLAPVLVTVALVSRSGSWLRDADGAPVLELDVPHPNCDLQRVWDAGLLLARCPASASDIPIRADVPVEQCIASDLWLVPVDGAESTVLAVPLDPDGYIECWGGYVVAAPIGDHVAVRVGGDGCSDDVVLLAPDGTVIEWLPFAESCTELLLGVRNGAWLLSVDAELVADSDVFEVTPESTTRLDLPPGGITVL